MTYVLHVSILRLWLRPKVKIVPTVQHCIFQTWAKKAIYVGMLYNRGIGGMCVGCAIAHPFFQIIDIDNNENINLNFMFSTAGFLMKSLK